MTNCSCFLYLSFINSDKDEAKNDSRLRHNALLVWAPMEDIPNTKCMYNNQNKMCEIFKWKVWSECENVHGKCTCMYGLDFMRMIVYLVVA